MKFENRYYFCNMIGNDMPGPFLNSKRIVLCSLFVALFFLSSCSTILFGLKAKVVVDSPDAVSADLMVDGWTYPDVLFPAEIEIKRGYKPSVIVAESEGYEGSVTVKKKFNPAALVSILGSVPGIIIDCVEGTVTEPEDEEYTIQMYPKQDADQNIMQPIGDTTAKKKWFNMHVYFGLNEAKCALGTVANYEQSLWNVESLHVFLPVNLAAVDCYQITSVENYYYPGLSFGIMGEFRLNDHLAFQANPTISIGSQKIVYNVVLYDDNGTPLVNENGVDVSHHSVEERGLENDNWLELPLLLKYSIHGFESVYLVGGITPRISMDKANWRGYAMAGGYYSTQYRLFLNPFDIGLDFGIAAKIYKDIGIQFKMSYGLMNLLNKKPNFYDGPLQSIKSKSFQIGIVF